jgi:predicted DNA-binding WGR domain protein
VTLIRRRDPVRRMARFYSLAVQADLLVGRSLVREWAGSAAQAVFALTRMRSC